METCLKPAVVILALAFSISPVLAQGTPQDPPAPQQEVGDGFGHGGPMHSRKPDVEHGRWGHGRFGEGNRIGRHGFGKGAREFGLARLLADPAIRQQVGITAEQAAKIRQQESDFRKTEIRGRADLQVKHIDLQELLAADKPDRAAINSKLQEISAARLALEKSAMDYRLTMREALSPEQREKLRQAMRHRWGRERGAGYPGPQGAGHGRHWGTAPGPSSQRQPQNPPPNK